MSVQTIVDNYEKHLEANWQWVKEYTRRMNKTCNPHRFHMGSDGITFCLECRALPDSEAKQDDVVFLPCYVDGCKLCQKGKAPTFVGSGTVYLDSPLNDHDHVARFGNITWSSPVEIINQDIVKRMNDAN